MKAGVGLCDEPRPIVSEEDEPSVKLPLSDLGSTFSDVSILDDATKTRLSRLPPPKHSKGSAVPFDKRLRLHNYERIAPVEEFGEKEHHGASAVGPTPRPDVTLAKKRQLFPQEQILSDQGYTRQIGANEVQ